jgi:hypothetical protein
MTKEELAAKLDGNEYGKEISKELEQLAAAAGLVVVFGGSDDLVELRGTIHEEEGAPGTIYLTKRGLFKPECEDDDCPHEERLRKACTTLNSHWGEEGFSFTYSTDIPHASFIIKEDGDNYCRGIVFALADVPAD